VFQVHHEPESAGSSLYVAFNTETDEILLKAPDRHTSADFVAFLTDILINQPRDVYASVPDLRKMLIRYIRHYNQLPWSVKST
jgi:hypothetical protein